VRTFCNLQVLQKYFKSLAAATETFLLDIKQPNLGTSGRHAQSVYALNSESDFYQRWRRERPQRRAAAAAATAAVGSSKRQQDLPGGAV